jgi:hypothetical protein
MEHVQEPVYVSAQFIIKPGEKLCDFLLRNRGGEINIPGGQAGKGFRIAREQAVQEGGTASQVADDEKRLFDHLSLMTWEENIVQKKADPMDQRPERPDGVKHQEKKNALACQTGGGVFGGEE